jgi:hypothetical protein
MSVKTARACDLEQQLAQLRWHRMQNERSIRNSLEATKVLKQKDAILGLTVDHASNKAMRVSSVIRDELSRPLVITDAELHEIQREDNRVKKRLDKVSYLSPFFCLMLCFNNIFRSPSSFMHIVVCEYAVRCR